LADQQLLADWDTVDRWPINNCWLAKKQEPTRQSAVGSLAEKYVHKNSVA
jgi:hypothetical protein